MTPIKPSIAVLVVAFAAWVPHAPDAHDYIDVKSFVVRSNRRVPAGKHELAMKFDYEGGKEMGKSGTITLFVDGKAVGSGKVDQTSPFKYSLSENQDVGQDTGTPVVYDYQGSFAFQGKLDEVVGFYDWKSAPPYSEREHGALRKALREQLGGPA